MNKFIGVAGIMAIVLIPAGCKAVGSEEKPEDLVLESVPKASSEVNMPAKTKPGPGMQPLVEVAVNDLAETMGIEKEKIKVVSAKPVSWPDSSAGCPQPGMQYMQVITSGSQIVLKAENKLYHYHSGGNRPPFYCPKPAVRKPLPHGED